MKRSGFPKPSYEVQIERLRASQTRQREKAAKAPSRKKLSRGKPLERKRALSQRPKRAKKTADGDSAKDIKLECDQLVREIVALRDKKCFTCPQREGLQVGHLIRRGIESVRWDLENCWAQCDRCNSRHEERPHIYEDAFIMRFGGVKLANLIIRADYRGKLTYIELSVIRDNLRKDREFWAI